MKQEKSLRDIRNRLGLSRRIIQGYEKKGLIEATARNKYGHLLYDEETVVRIAQIRFYQELGFSLKEIREFIDQPLMERKRYLKKQVELLKQQQSRLKEEIRILEDYLKDEDDKKLEEKIWKIIGEERE